MSQTPRKVVIEHFTNTDCSICASKNPAFYATLRKYPQVIHIAYHPDQPHPTCLLSHENRLENVARTQFYNVYGATPRAVISGTVITPKTPMIDSSDITIQLHQYSAISLVSKMMKINSDSINVVTTVITTDTMSYRKIFLLVNVTEDTIVYTGTNGEPEHFDVFHKQLYTGRGLSFVPATHVGDSVVFHTGFRIGQVDSIWHQSRINLISMVQDSATHFIYQAEKQTSIDTAALSAGSLIQFAAGDTVLYSGTTDANSTFAVSGNIQNNGNSMITVAWELIDSFGQPMWQYTGFCDPNLCYNFVLNHPVSFQLASHASAALRLDLIAHCVPGKGNVTCHIWDEADSTHSSLKEVFAFDLSPNGSCSSGISEARASGISLHPNPARQRLYIEAEGTIAGRQLEIIDILGTVVYSQPLHPIQIIDLSGLSSGLYLSRIYEGGQLVVVQKFIKE